MGLSPQAMPADQSCSILRPVGRSPLSPGQADALYSWTSSLWTLLTLMLISEKTFTCIHTCMHTLVCMRTYVHMHVCARACTCTYAHMHIYTHACKCICRHLCTGTHRATLLNRQGTLVPQTLVKWGCHLPLREGKQPFVLTSIFGKDFLKYSFIL